MQQDEAHLESNDNNVPHTPELEVSAQDLEVLGWTEPSLAIQFALSSPTVLGHKSRAHSLQIQAEPIATEEGPGVCGNADVKSDVSSKPGKAQVTSQPCHAGDSGNSGDSLNHQKTLTAQRDEQPPAKCSQELHKGAIGRSDGSPQPLERQQDVARNEVQPFTSLRQSPTSKSGTVTSSIKGVD